MTDQQLPDPLVPAEVDLRDFPFVPVEFRRLFASQTWILGNTEERCAAMCLWLESWHGTPAASLPDNDRMLAHLSQSGARWGKVKAHVMRGWVKCSDGNLYHPVVAEKALEAWAKHKKASSKGKAGAAKRWGTSNSTGNSAGIDQLMPKNSNRSGTDIGTEKDSGHPQNSGREPDPPVDSSAAPALEIKAATKRGAMAKLLRNQGVAITPENPFLLAWLDAGLTDAQANEAVARARLNKPPPNQIPAKYLDPIVADVLNGGRSAVSDLPKVDTSCRRRTADGAICGLPGVVHPVHGYSCQQCNQKEAEARRGVRQEAPAEVKRALGNFLKRTNEWKTTEGRLNE